MAVIAAIVIVVQLINDSGIEAEAVEVRLGYLSIVDGVPIFAAVENGYFEEENIKLVTTKFATSNQLAEAVINGDIDYGAIVSSSVVFSIEQRAPNSFKALSAVLHPSDKPFSAVLLRLDSTLSLEELKDKKIGIFPGSTSLALSKIAFKNLIGSDFTAEYVQMPPNLWLDSLSTSQVDAIISYEPFATLAIENNVAKILYNGFYEKHVMDNAPTALSIVTTQYAEKNPDLVRKIQSAIKKGETFVSANENEARLIATKYIPITESVALKMNLQGFEVGQDIDFTKLQNYADILYEAGELEKKIDVTSLKLS